MYVTRRIAAGLLGGCIALSVACSSFDDHEEVDFTFDNRTDALVCFERSEKGVAEGGCPQKIKPMAETSGRIGCGYGSGADEISLTIILIAAEGERRIYNRTEECRVWQKSTRTIVINRRGDNFVVTDSLSDES